MSKKNLPPTNSEEEVEAHLEAQFQKMGQEIDAPSELEKEVFDSLDTIHLFADFLDLFTVKFAQTELEVLGFDPDEDVAASEKIDEKKQDNKNQSSPK